MLLIVGRGNSFDGGASALGVCTTLSVRGTVLIAGDATLGLSGSLVDGVCDTARDALPGVPASTGVSDEATGGSCFCFMTAAVMSSLPGCLRFDESMALYSAFLPVSTSALASTLDVACASEGAVFDASGAFATLLTSSAVLSSG